MPRLADLEDLIAASALGAMVVLPLLDVAVGALFGVGLPGSGPIVQHLVLWVGLLGGAIAARDGKLLALATGALVPAGRLRRVLQGFAAAVAAGLTLSLAWGAFLLVRSEFEAATSIVSGLPVWVAQLVLPGGLLLIAFRLAWNTSGSPGGRMASLAGLALAGWLLQTPESVEANPLAPWLLLLGAAAVCGAPLFAVLGGAAVVLFMRDGVTPAAVAVETYSLVTSATLPALPLFTLAGFLLAEGRASARLLRVFRAWFGGIPGGTAVVCAVLCSFFTAFTGGSGVTILALGGLLLPALIADGYGDRFAIGLLTASGSLGLLLPPALPLILYGLVAQVPMEDLFLGGLLPGALLTGLTAAWGVRRGLQTGAARSRFMAAEAGQALWDARWELALPPIALGSLFSGRITATESAALVAAYALLVQTVVHRDITTVGALRRVFAECVTVVGGVLIILGVAVGFTNYLVSAEVPAHLLAWTTSQVSSRLLFLLGLNAVLLVVGCLMDIFSATAVIAPLLVPLGAAYGVHPVHLGIIFIANLELGYLTPPVGLNLFLASYRFKRPLLEVCRASLPMLAILGVGVLVITYVPWLTLGILTWLGR